MIKELLNWKRLVTSLAIAIFMVCGTVAYIYIVRPGAPEQVSGPVPAILTIIPAPTSTPRPLPPTLTFIPPTATLPPTLAPGEFGVGVYVQISNTGDEGLNIRSEPGLSAEVVFPGFDSEVFLVSGGPQEVDGYTWWLLTASYDANRSGWAAEDFLTVIPAP